MERIPELSFTDFLLSQKELSTKDLERFKTEKTLEALLQQVVEKGFLLHGSKDNFEGNLKLNNNVIFACNNPAIAILKSLFSNQEADLHYPYTINDKNPLILTLKSIKGESERDQGYIYVIQNNGFINDPPDSWQYKTHKDSVKVVAKVEIKREDFKYPVIKK